MLSLSSPLTSHPTGGFALSLQCAASPLVLAAEPWQIRALSASVSALALSTSNAEESVRVRVARHTRLVGMGSGTSAAAAIGKEYAEIRQQMARDEQIDETTAKRLCLVTASMPLQCLIDGHMQARKCGGEVERGGGAGRWSGRCSHRLVHMVRIHGT